MDLVRVGQIERMRDAFAGIAVADWNETDHPRGQDGKFGESDSKIQGGRYVATKEDIERNLKAGMPLVKKDLQSSNQHVRELAEKKFDAIKSLNKIEKLTDKSDRALKNPLPQATKEQTQTKENTRYDAKIEHTITPETIHPKDVVTTQPHVLYENVRAAIERNNINWDKPTVVKSGDKYVVMDGNHRMAAALLMNQKIDVLVYRPR